jgi:hypothetical protein
MTTTNKHYRDILEFIKSDYSRRCHSDPGAAERYMKALTLLGIGEPGAEADVWEFLLRSDDPELHKIERVIRRLGPDLSLDQLVNELGKVGEQ